MTLRLHERVSGKAAAASREIAPQTSAALPTKVVNKSSTAPRPPWPLPPGADVYEGLAKQSLHLTGVRAGAGASAVALVIPAVKSGGIFAGVATALEFGRALAIELDRPLRVVPLGTVDLATFTDEVERFLTSDGQPVPALEIVPQPSLWQAELGPDDLWVVTYWTTAHAADVACRLGVLDPSRVVYLIQDYEPGFHAWSVSHALTRQTYHAGFHHVVNSASLSVYLSDREGVTTDHELTFAPHLDLDRLRRVAAAREASPIVRVFFYARPSKPRNLYQLGVGALRVAANLLAEEGIKWEAVSAGETHADIDLPTGDRVRALGNLSWDGYYELLSQIDVGLTLMHSPHPSHPPLEVAVSGARAVTNDLDGARADFHDRISTAAADPADLGRALANAIRVAGSEGPAPFAPPDAGRLGAPLVEVVRTLVSRLSDGGRG